MITDINIDRIHIVDSRYGVDKDYGYFEVYIFTTPKHTMKFDTCTDPRPIIKTIFPNIPDELITEQ